MWIKHPCVPAQASPARRVTAGCLSVVIPTYGRAHSLAETVAALHAYLEILCGTGPDGNGGSACCGNPEIGCGTFEIVLVDDASPDGTASVLRDLCVRYPKVRGCRLAMNCGQQNATLAGVRMAHGDRVITMDDDRKNDFRDIPRLLDRLSAGYDVVYGVPPASTHARAHRRWGTRVKEGLLALVCGKPVSVRLTSFRAMNRAAADRVAAETRRHVYVSATLLQAPVRIGQVTVRETPDAVSVSGYRLVSLAAPLWHIAVQYGRYPLARLIRGRGEPCPVGETFGCD